MMKKKTFLGHRLALAASLVFIGATIFTGARAADLGGGCCADLEERIAELEATTARKGVRKVNLTISGQVNAAILHSDLADERDTIVTGNPGAGDDHTYVGFSASVKLDEGFAAGGRIEFAMGEDGVDADGYYRDDTSVFIRQSYVWFGSDYTGHLSIGRLSTATDNITQDPLTNIDLVAPFLSVKPVFLSDGFDIFDGSRERAVRYDASPFKGLSVSAAFLSDSEGFDAAARYRTEFQGFAIAAGVGYKDVDQTNLAWFMLDEESRTISGHAAIKHLTTGIFIAAAYGDTEIGALKADAWHVHGGVSRKFAAFGETTLYAEYGKGELDGLGDADLWGFGAVQAVDAAAIDFYLGYRQSDDIDASTVLGGARMKF